MMVGDVTIGNNAPYLVMDDNMLTTTMPLDSDDILNLITGWMDT